jgi:hypothetical protein
MFAIGVTPARAEKLRFTSPHLASDIYAITSRNNRRIVGWDDIDKAGTVVAVAKGTLHEPVMKAKLKAAHLVILDTPFAREQEVESGRADVFMTDYPYSRRFLANADWARLVSPTRTYHVTPYAYAVKPGDTTWFERSNASSGMSNAMGVCSIRQSATSSKRSWCDEPAPRTTATHVHHRAGAACRWHGGDHRFTVWRLRTDSIVAGLETSALHSRSFEDLITQNLHVIGLIAAHAVSGALEGAETGGGSARFAATLARAPYLRSMSFVDADGRIVSSSNPDNLGLTIETARFLPLVAGGQELLRVGLPWVGRDFVSGRPAQGGPVDDAAPTFIPVTQTVRQGDRVLTVLFALNPDYFINLFSRKVGEHEGVVRVLRYDGVLLMSTDPKEHPGRCAP